MNIDLIQLKEELLNITNNAGNAILEVYQEAGDINIRSKEDHSPLTLADERSNAVICKGLRSITPDIPIISEENKEIPYRERKDFDPYWLVDPLDGTKEFIKRNGEFTVNIALIRNQKPILSVVGVPVLGELYWAIKDQGAFLIVEDRIKRLRSKSFRMKDPNLRVVCSRSHLNEETQQFLDKLKDPERVSRGSSLKFLIIAKGEAELYPRLAPTMEWDTAAAQLVLEEAGGDVVRADDHKSLLYNKFDLLNPHFIAYGRMEAET